MIASQNATRAAIRRTHCYRTGQDGRMNTADAVPGSPGHTHPPEPATDGDTASGYRPRMRISDPRVMRALAHPARLAVLDQLVDGGTATATECARIAGLSPSAMSYHLRALARIGMIEQAPAGGDARERRWRASPAALAGVNVESDPDATPEGRAAEHELVQAWLVREDAHVRRWLERRADERPEWDRAVAIAEIRVRVTREELEEINRRFYEMLHRFVSSRRRDAPPDARQVAVQYRTIPMEFPAP